MDNNYADELAENQHLIDQVEAPLKKRIAALEAECDLLRKDVKAFLPCARWTISELGKRYGHTILVSASYSREQHRVAIEALVAKGE